MARFTALKNSFTTDADLEEKGSILRLPNGAWFRVRSQMSKTARLYAQRQVKKHRHLYANGELPSLEQQDEMDVELCANALLSEWGAIEDDATGQPLPFSREKAKEFMEVPLLRRQVMTFSLDATNYRAIEGNSAPSSPQN
jgi:hypothetical protein